LKTAAPVFRNSEKAMKPGCPAPAVFQGIYSGRFGEPHLNPTLFSGFYLVVDNLSVFHLTPVPNCNHTNDEPSGVPE
jgi:hypothetical protein